MTTGTAQSPQSATTVHGKSPVGRIQSLDVVRGVFLIASVASESVLPPRPRFLKHSEWFGITPIDLVFPLFVTLSGCGLAFAYRNQVGWGATLRRSAVLLLCGLAYNAVAAGSLDLQTLRFTGPLQIYAVLVLIIGLLHLVSRTPRAWIALTVSLATAQAALLAMWQSGCPGESLSQMCNPSRALDLPLFGQEHVYAAGALGHDPEGVVAIVGALVTACAGVTAGHLALAGRGTHRGPFHLTGWAMAVFAMALAAGSFLPEMKRPWTTPFGLGVAALGIVILAVGMALMDLPADSAWRRSRALPAWPLIALGRNSLFVYFGSHLLVLVLRAHGGPTSWAEQVASRLDFLGDPRRSFLISSLVLWILMTAVLHRQRIYLRP